MRTLLLAVTELDDDFQTTMRSLVDGPDYAEEIAAMDARRGTKMFMARLTADDGNGEPLDHHYGIHIWPPGAPEQDTVQEYSFDCNRDDGAEIVDLDMAPTEDAALLAALNTVLAHEIVPP